MNIYCTKVFGLNSNDISDVSSTMVRNVIRNIDFSLDMTAEFEQVSFSMLGSDKIRFSSMYQVAKSIVKRLNCCAEWVDVWCHCLSESLGAQSINRNAVRASLDREMDSPLIGEYFQLSNNGAREVIEKDGYASSTSNFLMQIFIYLLQHHASRVRNGKVQFNAGDRFTLYFGVKGKGENCHSVFSVCLIHKKELKRGSFEMRAVDGVSAWTKVSELSSTGNEMCGSNVNTVYTWDTACSKWVKESATISVDDIDKLKALPYIGECEDGGILAYDECNNSWTSKKVSLCDFIGVDGNEGELLIKKDGKWVSYDPREMLFSEEHCGFVPKLLESNRNQVLTSNGWVNVDTFFNKKRRGRKEKSSGSK